MGGRPVSDDPDQVRSLRAELWQARADVLAEAGQALAARVTELGGTVGYRSTSAPIVFLDLPESAVAALADRADVVSMSLEGTWAETMSAAGKAVDANWHSGTADSGAGVRVGVVEYHNVRETGDLANKVVANWAVGGTIRYTGSGTFDHPTWVAGAIAGQSTSYRGVAPGALIVSAGTGGYSASLAYDRRVIAAADWAISPAGGDADVVNTSLVQDTATGSEEARRFFDSISYLDGRLPISAAGNYVNFGGWQIGSPGTGYNVLTVGGVDDRGTAARGDDRIWYVPGSNGSNWLDRPSDPWNSHGDFNKPNLVAPAVGVRTANGLAATGTSVATPIVAGVAAQLLSNEPALLAWPEASRAVLMAGAVHRVPMPDGSRNVDHEGVGMSSALWTNRISAPGDGLYGGYRLGAMDDNDRVVQNIAVRPGDRLRVALAWNSHSSSADDTLTADLDLRVTLPNGSVVGSYTLDNAYEFVEVSVPTGGTASLEIVQSRFDASSERYGLAWAKVGDRTAPTARPLQPQHAEPWVVPSNRPQVVFSEAVTGLTQDTVSLRAAGSSQDIPVDLDYNASTRTLTLSPTSALSPGGYTLALRNGISDAAWNALGSTTWSFTVRSVGSPSTAGFSPTRRVTFSAGTHVGYRFSASGVPIASKAYRLAATSGASVDRRATLPGVPGTWLRVTNGVWAGYWIQESAAARLAGEYARQSLSPAQRIVALAGTHVGYRFDATGRVTATRSYTLGKSSGASVSRRSVINGAVHLYVIDGVWAGYWVRETSRFYLPGARDLRDLSGARLAFAPGTYTGTLFTSAGGVLAQKAYQLGKASSAPVSGWGIINGVSRFYVTAGVWAGYWVPASSGAHLP
jgi:hypothetical protein